MVDILDGQIAEIRALMETRLRISGRDFHAQIRRAGRLLPRALRRDARYLAKAADLAQNPKLVPMIDTAKTQRAHTNLVAFLNDVDPGARLRANLLSIASSIALVLVVVFVVVLYVLVKQGHV